MPTHVVEVSCPVADSFRVQQVAGMLDVPLAERVTERFEAELPGLDEPWSIGLIVGPSGSGKSTLARQAYGDRVARTAPWPVDRAVVDCFEPLGVRETVALFTAVGLGSAPAWIKPHHVLSGGERFRCDLARALAGVGEGPPEEGAPRVVVFDEFTSVVDRNVARVCSAAVSKGVRSGRLAARFVAVTCHYDVADWLEPDWVLDMATRTLHRRRLRRPPIELEVHRCGVEAWPLFARHHYLSGSLALQARCYLASWQGEPVAFAATLPTIAQRGRRRFTRLVTLPDYQGIGIGSRLLNAVACMHHGEGYRVGLTTSHPALVGYCKRSPHWKATALKKTGQSPGRSRTYPNYRNSAGRAVASFEYIG